MVANKQIPEMNSYAEMAEFWDSHSLADYWDQTEPAEFQIAPDARRFLGEGFSIGREAQRSKRLNFVENNKINIIIANTKGGHRDG